MSTASALIEMTAECGGTDGMDSVSIRAAITEREAELSSITAKALSQKEGSVHEQVSGLRKFVKENLRDIRALIAGKYGNPFVVRRELAKHIESITLLPEGEGREIRYRGSWKVLGRRYGVCRGPESDWLRRPFQGRALPMSYLGTGAA